MRDQEHSNLVISRRCRRVNLPQSLEKEVQQLPPGGQPRLRECTEETGGMHQGSELVNQKLFYAFCVHTKIFPLHHKYILNHNIQRSVASPAAQQLCTGNLFPSSGVLFGTLIINVS